MSPRAKHAERPPGRPPAPVASESPQGSGRSRPLRILIADDHGMVREGLRALLDRAPGIEVVAEAHDGRGAIRATQEHAPDIVLMDVGLPGMNGIEATRQITSEDPGPRVIALSAYSDRRYVLNMLKAGARGYLLKDSASEELLRAVHAISRGDGYLSPEITGVVVNRCLQGEPNAEPETSAFTLLGAREREVLQLIAEGLTTPAIAKRLFISPKTVETHRRNLMRKLGIHTIAELTKYAVREGLTGLEQ